MRCIGGVPSPGSECNLGERVGANRYLDGEVNVSEIHKLRCVRALVRPDRRQEYLELWGHYVETVTAAGAKAALYEDQVLPGRFLETTEHVAAHGMESKLEAAYRESGLRRACVRREGDEILYRKLAT